MGANGPGAGEVSSACQAGAAWANGRTKRKASSHRQQADVRCREAGRKSFTEWKIDDRLGPRREDARTVEKAGVGAFLANRQRAE